MWVDAWAYDLATGPFDDDLCYWQAALHRFRPRRVLDLGCGTGRLTVPLAETGLGYDPDFAIVGLDASAAFLAGAESRLATCDPHVRNAVGFVPGDMAGFTLDGPFDLIIAGYNNLNYLTEPEQRRGCLRAVREHLTDHGRFGIDLHLPDLAGLSGAGRDAFPVMRKKIEWEHPAAAVARFVALFTTDGHDAVTQTEQTTHYWHVYFEDGTQRTIVKKLAWLHYFSSELRLLVELGGLRVVEEHGDYAWTPFGPSAANYLWRMEKTAPG
jgi:SAM-dependent methyltransferase